MKKRVAYEKALEEYNTALAAYNASVTTSKKLLSNKLAQAEYEAKLADYYKTKKLLMMKLSSSLLD